MLKSNVLIVERDIKSERILSSVGRGDVSVVLKKRLLIDQKAKRHAVFEQNNRCLSFGKTLNIKANNRKDTKDGAEKKALVGKEENQNVLVDSDCNRMLPNSANNAMVNRVGENQEAKKHEKRCPKHKKEKSLIAGKEGSVSKETLYIIPSSTVYGENKFLKGINTHVKNVGKREPICKHITLSPLVNSPTLFLWSPME